MRRRHCTNNSLTERTKNKLDEPGTQGVKKPLIDDPKSESPSYRKLADRNEAFVKLLQLLLDASIADLDAFNAQMSPILTLAAKGRLIER